MGNYIARKQMGMSYHLIKDKDIPEIIEEIRNRGMNFSAEFVYYMRGSIFFNAVIAAYDPEIGFTCRPQGIWYRCLKEREGNIMSMRTYGG
jgi:hypothetical protein